MNQEQEKDNVEESTIEDNETSYETDSTEEDETSEAEQGGEQHSSSKPTETPEQRSARIKRQVEREAKKAGLSVEKYLGIEGQKSSETDEERWIRTDLKVEGVKSKKEQDVVLNYIREKKLLGHNVDVETALKSMVVKEELTNIRNQSSVPAPSKRTAQVGGEKSLLEYAEMMKKGRTKEVPLDKQREIRKQRLIKW